VLLADALSGWLLVTLPELQHGLIIILMTPAGDNSNWRTTGWTCENNATTCDEVKGPGPNGECDYTIEYSINGVVKSWTSEEFKAQQTSIARLIDLSILLDDRDYVKNNGKGATTMDVELGIRVGGTCGRQKTMALSHIYWA
jgi:hypothetical protein